MCSIMGYCSQRCIHMKAFLERVCKEHISRGPDATRICRYRRRDHWDFIVLSIMGLNEYGMQPFQRGNHYVVCNGEIYGFRTNIKEELMKQGY